jgi:hypothetical protein
MGRMVSPLGWERQPLPVAPRLRVKRFDVLTFGGEGLVLLAQALELLLNLGEMGLCSAMCSVDRLSAVVIG